ncbi:MAG: MFS transporter [Thiohalomonadaceae bacterium]
MNKSVISWALYDWGNSAFATTVMAGFFPLFFKQYWSAGSDVTASTFQLGLANSLASLLIIFIAPALGAIADQGGARKGFLYACTLLGAGMTGGLYFVAQGEWLLAALLYVGGSSGFFASLIFYDALLMAVTTPARYDRVSALGFALGYLGGGLLFAFNVAMTLKPHWFGLPDAATAVRVSFLTVALWWGLFTLPLAFWVPEPPGGGRRGLAAVVDGFRQLRATFHEVRRLRHIGLFLLGYWCYIDAVDTIIRMAVDYGLAIGLPAASLIVALLITQFVGFPAAVLFGRLGERLGPRTGIYIAIVVYGLVVLWATRMETAAEFYLLAVVIGLVQGGIQSLSRSLYARLIPADKSAEFFGFYNMLGKFAAVIGPILVGWVSLATGEPRLSLLSLLVLFALGAWFLSRVNIEQGTRMARELE